MQENPNMHTNILSYNTIESDSSSIEFFQNTNETEDEVGDLPHVSFHDPKRMPSFKLLTTPVPSLEMLNPSPDSNLRKSSLTAATFNLIATIVGGGVLSMPLSLAKSGLFLGTLMMIFAAIITDFSLYILCSCARRTGATSFGGVARFAFGPALELATTIFILAYLSLVLVAFMVLVKGIWAPIILTILAQFNIDLGVHAGDAVLLFAIIVTLPLFLSHDLHGLRHSCYASFASITILAVAMIYRAYEKNTNDPTLFSNEVLFVTDKVTDALFAYPIIALAFVSSFNVISVHCALVDPTRERVRSVIHGAVCWSFLLMYLFSLGGYFYGYDETDGNILLNFDPTDKIIFLGRIGCGVCTLLAMPMSLLPCRDALLSLPIHFNEWLEWKRMSKKQRDYNLKAERIMMTPRLNRRQNGETSPLISKPPLLSKSPLLSPAFRESSTSTSKTSVETGDGQNEGNKSIEGHKRTIHILSTFAILSLCYIGAVIAPGVAIVWSLCGSSLAFLVQYIIPAACYIKIRAKRKGHFRINILSAWILLWISIFGAIACTAQTVWRIFFMTD